MSSDANAAPNSDGTTLSFTPNGWEDYLYWQKTDKKILRRINTLIKDTCRTPLQGLGKPEPLGFSLAGCWSRRIDHEHRLVYKYDGKSNAVIILACRYHY